MREYCAKCWNTTDLCLLYISWRCSGFREVPSISWEDRNPPSPWVQWHKDALTPEGGASCPASFPQQSFPAVYLQQYQGTAEKRQNNQIIWGLELFPQPYLEQSPVLGWERLISLVTTGFFCAVSLQKCTCVPCPPMKPAGINGQSQKAEGFLPMCISLLLV